MNDTIDNYPYSVFHLEQYTKLSDTQPILRSETGKFLHIAGKIQLQPFQSIDYPRRILPLQIPHILDRPWFQLNCVVHINVRLHAFYLNFNLRAIVADQARLLAVACIRLVRSAFVRLNDHEIDKFLTLKPARPHIVTLSLDHVKCHHSAQLSIPLRQFAGVLFERHHGVAIPMQVIDRDMRFRQRPQAVNRIILPQFGVSLLAATCPGRMRKAVLLSTLKTTPAMGSSFEGFVIASLFFESSP